MKFTYEINDESGITITGLESEPACKTLIVPQIIEGQRVTRIAKKAFYYREEIESAVLPDTVIEIGESAFSGCVNLKSVIARGAIIVGEYGFAYNQKLEYVDISNVTSLGKFAFYGCFSLKTISLNNNLSVIREGTFYQCENLESFCAPGVICVENEAFCDCVNLFCCNEKSKIVEISIPYIGRYAFKNTGLVSIELSYRCKYIGPGAFRGCQKLSTVTFRPVEGFVDQFAFADCHKITLGFFKGKVRPTFAEYVFNETKVKEVEL